MHTLYLYLFYLFMKRSKHTYIHLYHLLAMNIRKRYTFIERQTRIHANFNQILYLRTSQTIIIYTNLHSKHILKSWLVYDQINTHAHNSTSTNTKSRTHITRWRRSNGYAV
uniref:Uncharacterized protein n=1 Tax=Octopus bimaculoides TaxID=37653 RepID=A0A0L8ICU1_OCTBM